VQIDFIFSKTGTKLHRLFGRNNRLKVQLIDFVQLTADVGFSDRVAEKGWILLNWRGINCFTKFAS
jgi:hypothetical protein